MTEHVNAPLGTPIVAPIHHSAAYAFNSLADARAVFAQRASGYTYARTGNPTVTALESAVTRLERAECAVATSSGQAAVSLALLALTGPVNGGRLDGVVDGSRRPRLEIGQPADHEFL